MFGSGHYEITPHITAFLQGNFAETQLHSVLAAAPAVQFWGAAVPHDAAHPTTPELESLLNSRPTPGAPWALQITTDNIVGPRTEDATTTSYQVLAGLRGDLPNTDWTWEVYGSHGRTNFLGINETGFVSTQRWQQMVALPNYGQNANVSLLSSQLAKCTSGFYGAIFQGTKPSADCIDAITMKLQASQRLEQKIVEANIQGGLFNLPAGQVRFAAGADYREDNYKFIADPANELNSFVEYPVGVFGTSSTKGGISVKEVYGELLVPVLKDLPFAKVFNLELGIRWSDYSQTTGKGAGGSATYKALGDYAVTDWLRLRGGFQRAQRAPNIAELFQPSSPLVVGTASGDPCSTTTPVKWGNNASNPNRAGTQALCAALIKKFDPNFVYNGATFTGLFPFFFPITIDLQQGQPNLVPETADTFTAGAVIRSPFHNAWLDRLTISVDWYDIKIKDAIVSLTSNTIYEQCFNADGASNPGLTITGNTFCDYINREVGTGGNRNARAPFFNYGMIHTRGVDLQVDWSTPVPGVWGPGLFALNSVVNYSNKYEVQATPTGAIVNYANSVNGGANSGNKFKYRIYMTGTYSSGPASIGLRWKYFPATRDASAVLNPATTLQGVKTHHEVDLFARWRLSRTYEFRAGIDNLFDANPEVANRNLGATTFNSAQGTTLLDYDVLGRRFFVGVKARF